jgi:hypothetical protein
VTDLVGINRLVAARADRPHRNAAEFQDRGIDHAAQIFGSELRSTRP